MDLLGEFLYNWAFGTYNFIEWFQFFIRLLFPFFYPDGA